MPSWWKAPTPLRRRRLLGGGRKVRLQNRGYQFVFIMSLRIFRSVCSLTFEAAGSPAALVEDKFPRSSELDPRHKAPRTTANLGRRIDTTVSRPD